MPVTSPTHLDFDVFHRDADWLANGPLAAAELAGRAPLAVRLPDGRAYTYAPTGDGVELLAGDDHAPTVVEMDPDAWSDWAQELRTCFGLLYGGLVTASRGRLEALIEWEPAVRALFHGRPVYDPAVARAGLPNDLGRSFTLDDDPAEIRDAMHALGFLHIRHVFDDRALGPILAEVERLQAMARPGDDRSWWATGAEGDPVCCRLIYLSERSELLAGLHEDERLQRLVDLVTPDGATMTPLPDRGDGHTVVIKNPGATEGLSDLPWHVDCGLGGHPVLCPTVNLGIQLDAANADTGRLHFLAGSWRASCHQLSDAEMADGRYPTVAVDTEPGDVTLHFAHTLHAAPPPAGAPGSVRGRRALYLGWDNPAVCEVVPPGHGYNDVVLRSSADNQVLSVPEQLARQGDVR
jgi:hypothetical protein